MISHPMNHMTVTWMRSGILNSCQMAMNRQACQVWCQLLFLPTSPSTSVAFCWFLSHHNQLMLKGSHLSDDCETEVPSTSRAKAGQRALNSAEPTSRKAISLPSSILKPSELSEPSEPLECKLRFSLVWICHRLTYKVSASTSLSETPFDFNGCH